MKFKIAVFALSAGVFFLEFIAESQATPSPTPSAASSARVSASASANKVLSDQWYTITLGGTPYGYYNDRVELRQGRVFYQNHVWKREEGLIVEEQLGAYSEDDAQLAPLFFNYHSTYRATEIAIDGTITNRELTVKARKGGQDLPVIRRGLPKNAIFSVMFPYWLAKKASSLKPGLSESFLAIIEDNLDQGLATLSGRVKADKEPRKFQVNFRGIDSFWWLDESGNATRIEMPAQRMRVKRVTAAEAQRFLSGNEEEKE